MLPKINSYSILYITIGYVFGSCYGFVLLSSAANQNVELNLFNPGETLVYKLQNSVLLNEVGENTKNVGFFVEGEVFLSTIWAENSSRILKFELSKPRLNIKSRKAPTPDGFVPHSSNLEKNSNSPFYVIWTRGKIESIFMAKNEVTSLVNLKKGIASAFQFQILDKETQETDASGECTVIYKSSAPNKFTKTKKNCLSPDFKTSKISELILGAVLESKRDSEYELDLNNNIISRIHYKEQHSMFVSIKNELGNFIETEQTLKYIKTLKTDTINIKNIKNINDVLYNKYGVQLTTESIFTEREHSEETTFSKSVQNLRENLENNVMGTLKSASSFIKLVRIGRKWNREDIFKALSSKKNSKIMLQLYDILGHVQTAESHGAVMKKLHFDDENSIDESERYLWALATCAHPKPDILIDILNKYKKYDNIPNKVQETMVLSISSMTHRLRNLEQKDPVTSKVIRDVEDAIINNLDYAKNEKKFQFFRALKNLKSESTIPILLKYIKNGTQKEGVLSWKALKAMDRKHWTKPVLKSAEKSFFQIDRKYDTSSRTMAVDILLESNPCDITLKNLVEYLSSNDTAYEIKQYVFQSIKMISEKDPDFQNRILKIIRSDRKINNYSTLSPRGMSTALSRTFLSGTSSNGSWVSIQELNSGLVKRGIVNVMLEKDGISREMLSLGIFSGGLSSFVSSTKDENDESSDESANAGIELTVLGNQIRPFVFFEGQGELMGHVWSGTASDKTTAFQAMIMLQDHLEYLRLGTGYIAELDLKGAASFDLSGLIKISIFYSNAESLVEKSAGIVLSGSAKVDTTFVKSQVEFIASIEPKLKMKSDIDFSSKMKVCMKVTQPDSIFKHNIFKIERIPDSKHKLRIAKYKKKNIPGTTYSLNRKNNLMCSAMHNS